MVVVDFLLPKKTDNNTTFASVSYGICHTSSFMMILKFNRKMLELSQTSLFDRHRLMKSIINLIIWSTITVEFSKISNIFSAYTKQEIQCCNWKRLKNTKNRKTYRLIITRDSLPQVIPYRVSILKRIQVCRYLLLFSKTDNKRWAQAVL
jgi:hypothetical protein